MKIFPLPSMNFQSMQTACVHRAGYAWIVLPGTFASGSTWAHKTTPHSFIGGYESLSWCFQPIGFCNMCPHPPMSCCSSLDLLGHMPLEKHTAGVTRTITYGHRRWGLLFYMQKLKGQIALTLCCILFCKSEGNSLFISSHTALFESV